MSRTSHAGQGETLYNYDPESFIITARDIDSSSKLCFEEKSNKVNHDKIFQRIDSWHFQMQSRISKPDAPSHRPCKYVPNISLFEPKFQEKRKKSVCLKVNEKVQNTNIRKGVFKEEKIKSVSLKPINTYCGPKQSHCAIGDLERHWKRWESDIGEHLSELVGDLGSTVHTGRSATHPPRVTHTQPVRRWTNT